MTHDRLFLLRPGFESSPASWRPVRWSRHSSRR